MSLLVVGLSHRSAPVSVLERAALVGDEQAKLVQDTLAAEPATEAAVLATCNRIELYADVDKFHAGVAELSTLLAQHTGVGLDELTPYLYVHYEDRAVHHLFSVACGLDSMVVGEGQILGQIKDALALGQELHTAGRLLNDLFQQALRVGKRAHSETGIDRAGQSLVTFGLEQLAQGAPVAEWARGKRALVIGAGSMSSLAAATLARAGVSELVIANRTLERALRLAESLAQQHAATPAAITPAGDEAAVGAETLREGLVARAVPRDRVSAELPHADIVVSCTGATGLVLSAAELRTALAQRAACPPGAHPAAADVSLLDLAMPRDIDAAAHRIEGLHLVDIESLAEAAAEPSGAPGSSAGAMAADVDRVRAIVSEEVAAFGAAQRAAHITPTVVALRTMAADVVASEIARLDGRLPDLDDKQRAEITQTVRRVVDKLLHAPTVRVKQLASTPGGAGYADALRELFDLDPQAVAAVSRADGSARTAEPNDPKGGRA
ncbi:glutamyl-tRNA reductase [Streptomyces rapamycinicus]|uniref:Glutamyl-tRNA reductase n=2 Tax=Streptomyces rapamycinicus TaxID=1226757 RepID=A0A0A0NNT7_STRRN|nr:glutamyl-tRNA reductase [Streptomyces rapamycinicus]AGP56010.1 glutamyl-tRNA reductase [Streptomyces rapamycinicus NRRL 5491]MBB4783611.1 glutamyl-tRNA reductase [Streptomyces rapamycinicus]RLV80916.1 glutamyl-tRNA reductase [Streptomyces rapamycinicus NRRL 5491]UTO63985.1 glutamyl-tRNA reductase [Streptomyces rapamycinicus]UTP31938.1 glutamyl-tRNA reductase [Streptomyces rapamycinicus NRRL 5491]